VRDKSNSSWLQVFDVDSVMEYGVNDTVVEVCDVVMYWLSCSHCRCHRPS